MVVRCRWSARRLTAPGYHHGARGRDYCGVRNPHKVSRTRPRGFRWHSLPCRQNEGSSSCGGRAVVFLIRLAVQAGACSGFGQLKAVLPTRFLWLRGPDAVAWPPH